MQTVISNAAKDLLSLFSSLTAHRPTAPRSPVLALPPSRHTPAPNSPATKPTTYKSPTPSQTENVSTPGTQPRFPRSAPKAAAPRAPKPATNALPQTAQAKSPPIEFHPSRTDYLNEPPNGHLPDPSQPHPSSKNSLRKIIIPPTSINRKMPLASQNPATIFMFRLRRPSLATRASAAVGMVGAAGPVISCFPHELQYRVPELNGLPQPSQYMFLPPSSLATDQYYVPHPKMFQAPSPATPSPTCSAPPLHLGHFTLSFRSVLPSPCYL